MVAPPLGAQEKYGDVEEIVVTGSLIARPDFESASPIVSVGSDIFTRTNPVSVDTVVSRLPQFVPSYTSTSNNPANGGQGNLSLRGLAPASTMVLLDGRRVIPANGNGSVDVNVIPGSLIESVEVITGGASAVYGSDAIAGVVNFKLKDEFDGVQFDGNWNETGSGDATERSVGVTAGTGFGNGRGQVYGYVGYAERDAVLQGDREFSEVAVSYSPDDRDFLPTGIPSIIEGRLFSFDPRQLPSNEALESLFATYGYPAGSIPFYDGNSPINGIAFNADGTMFSTGTGDPGSVANFRGERDPRLFDDRRYSYNVAPANYLQLPLDRLSAFGRASFELGPSTDLFAEVLYADYSADTQLAPAPANNLSVPITNPYIPADLKLLLDSRDAPDENFSVAKRLAELGPRIASHQHDVLQTTAGARGVLSGEWTYTAYAQVGSYDSTESQQGNALRSKVGELLTAADGGQAACGGFNLFGPGSISQECARYIAFGGTNRSGYDQSIVEFSATGPALQLPADALQLAAGVLYKKDEYFYNADPMGLNLIGFSGTDDIEGSDHNVDAYVEALLPLLQDAPAAKELNAVLGYRRSDYESAGGVDSYKAELLYQPAEPVRLRSSWQHAVRAASVFELFLPQLPTEYDADPNFGLNDPCAADSPERNGDAAAEVEALCLAQGVPADLLPDFADSDGIHPGVVGGNPDLDPETADTLAVGIVLQPGAERPLLAALQLSLDWYRIEVSDAISDTVATDYVPLCFNPDANPGLDPDFDACHYFGRNADSGELENLTDIKRNIAGYTVSGIDMQLDWRIDAGPGSFGASWLLAWMDRFEVQQIESFPAVDQVGGVGFTVGGSLPEWKSNLNLRYAWSALTLAAQWRYIDEMRDRDVTDYKVRGYDYIDLYAEYAFERGVLDGLIIRAGVENLTNEDPPLLPSWVQANTDPSQYDVLGRRYLLSASYRF